VVGEAEHVGVLVVAVAQIEHAAAVRGPGSMKMNLEPFLLTIKRKGTLTPVFHLFFSSLLRRLSWKQ
jgi:hypothetical protein